MEETRKEAEQQMPACLKVKPRLHKKIKKKKEIGGMTLAVPWMVIIRQSLSKPRSYQSLS